MKVCQTDQSDRSIVVHITVTGSVTSRLEYRQPQLLLIDSFDKKNIFWPRPCSRCNIAMFLRDRRGCLGFEQFLTATQQSVSVVGQQGSL